MSYLFGMDWAYQLAWFTGRHIHGRGLYMYVAPICVAPIGKSHAFLVGAYMISIRFFQLMVFVAPIGSRGCLRHTTHPVAY